MSNLTGKMNLMSHCKAQGSRRKGQGTLGMTCAFLPWILYLCMMQFSSSLLENAVNEFAKLPGVGKKTALRLVLHLLKQDPNDVSQFSEVIAKMRSEIKFCQRCFNVAD